MTLIKSPKIKLAQYVFAGFLVLFLVVLFFRFADLKALIFILKQGIWYYVLIFFLLQIAYLLSQPLIFLHLYKIFSKTGRLWELMNIFLATNFVNLALPLVGVSGIVAFIGYAQKTGLSKTQAIIINALFYILVFFSFIFIIPLIFISPHQLADISLWEKNIIIIFGVAILLCTYLFFMIIKNTQFMDKIVRGSSGFINKIYHLFSKKILISKVKLATILDEFYFFRLTIKNKITLLIKPFFYALLGHILHVLVLYFIFLSFSVSVPIIVPIIGYIISVVFILVSVTPSGVGIVEPLMILFFTSEGIPLEIATVVTLIFRGIVFWLPFILGFFSLRFIHFYKSNETKTR